MKTGISRKLGASVLAFLIAGTFGVSAKAADQAVVDTPHSDGVQIVENNNYGQKAREYWKGTGVYDGYGNYTFQSDETITASRNGQAPTIGNASNNYFVDVMNMFAPVMKGGDGSASIDMNGHNLTLIADHSGTSVNPAGIYVNSGTLTIKNPGAVNVDIKDGQFGYGLDVEGTSGMGSWNSGTGNARLVIQNDNDPAHAVKVRTDGASSNYGLLFANGNTGSAELDIEGLVDLKTSSHDAVRAWTGAVNIGGGTIVSEGTNAWNAIESAVGSKVTVNADVDKNNTLTVKSDKRDVKITGDITAESKGRVALGLATKDSVFKGAVNADVANFVNTEKTYTEGENGVRTPDPSWEPDSKKWADNPGDVYMALNNGALWDHQQISTASDAPNKNSKNESRLARLSADGGRIAQNSSRNIVVDSYGGNASVYYEHDSTNPTAVKGGSVTIKEADKNSTIALVTDSKGLEKGLMSGADSKDVELVNQTMKALAAKLVYEQYKDGNLAGTVEVAEGLLTPGKVYKTGTIVFGENGVGTYDASSTASEYRDDIQIVEDNYYGTKAREYWKEAGVSDGKGNYTFDRNETITASRYNQTLKDNSENNYFVNKLNMYAPIMKGGDSTTNIDMQGHDLTLVADHGGVSVDPAGIYVTSGTLNINNTGAVTSQTKDAAVGYGLYVQGTSGMGTWASGNGHAKLVINNDDSKDHAVNVSVASDENYGLLVAEGNTGSADLIVKGLVNAETDKHNAIRSLAGNIDIGGGTISSTDWGAVYTNFGGRVAINGALDEYNDVHITSDKRDVKVTGDINAEGKGSVILGLGTKDSYFTGVVNADIVDLVHPGETYVQESNGVLRPKGFDHPVDTKWEVNPGYVSMDLENGAVWNHQQVGTRYHLADSHLADLVSHGGVINQNDNRNIIVDYYDGNSSVFYNHDAADPTNITGGSFTIKAAAPNSSITLITSSKGLEKGLVANASDADKDLVNRTMNILAGKLKYVQYGDKDLTGTIEIAEGLLTPSKVYKTGTISFRESGDQAGTGYYDYVPSSGVTEYQDSVQIVEDNYYGQKAKDYWKGAGVYDGKGNYSFDRDETITASRYNMTADNNSENNWFVTKMNMFAPIMKGGDNSSVINMNGHNLNLVADHSGVGINPAGIYVSSGTLTINTPGAINVDIKDGQFGYGIDVEGTSGMGTWASGSGNAKLVINNDDSLDHAVKVRTDGAFSNYGLLFANGNSGSAELDIKGLVDLKTSSHDAIRAWNAAVNVGGGTIVSEGDNAWNAIESGLGSKVTVNADLDKDGNIALKSDSRDVKIVGDVTAESHGRVALGLGTSNSSFKGTINADVAGLVNPDATYTEKENGVRTADPIWGENHKEWRDNPGDVYMTLSNGAVWDHQQVSTAKDAPNKNSRNESRLARLSGNGGIIKQNSDRDIRVESFGGNATVIYQHDKEQPANIIGGNFRVETADTGSHVNMVTDASGLNTLSTDQSEHKKVLNTLDALAHKLVYEDFANGKKDLSGTVTISEGLLTPGYTASFAAARTAGSTVSGSIDFGSDGAGKLGTLITSNDDTNGNSGDKTDVIVTPVTPEPSGHFESSVMKGIKSAQMAGISLWRSNNNDLHRRMGDLRLSSDNNGVWAKYLGGRNSMSKDAGLTSNYNIYQAGYDKKVGGNWFVGGAVDYGTSSDSYRGYGSGDGKLASLALYGTMMKEDGQYLDIILRGSHVKNDYTVKTENFNVDGNYSTWGTSFSVEYGKKFAQDNGFYITPSAEFTLGRLNGKSYTAHTTAGDLSVKQDGFNSAVGRLGVSFGKQNSSSSYFGRIGLAHEFSGNADFYYNDGEVANNNHVDLGDTWYEMEFGGTFQLNKNTYFYGTYTRSFGATLNQDWRLDLGLRFSF